MKKDFWGGSEHCSLFDWGSQLPGIRHSTGQDMILRIYTTDTAKAKNCTALRKCPCYQNNNLKYK
jgi:hypothetical protein